MLLKRKKKSQRARQYLRHTERNILSRGQPQISSQNISILLCMIGYAMHKKNLKLVIFKSSLKKGLFSFLNLGYFSLLPLYLANDTQNTTVRVLRESAHNSKCFIVCGINMNILFNLTISINQ